MSWHDNRMRKPHGEHRGCERKSEQKFFIAHSPIMFVSKSLFNFSCRALRWCVARAKWKKKKQNQIATKIQGEKRLSNERAMTTRCASTQSTAIGNENGVPMRSQYELQRHWHNPMCWANNRHYRTVEPDGIHNVNGVQRSFFSWPKRHTNKLQQFGCMVLVRF